MKNKYSKLLFLVVFSILLFNVSGQSEMGSNSNKTLFNVKFGLNVLPKSNSNKLQYNLFTRAQIESVFLLKEKYLFGLTYGTGMYNPEYIPEDYVPFNLFGTNFKYANFSFLIGYHSLVNKSKTIGLNLKGGISFITFTEAKNWKKKEGLFLFGNYSYDYYKKRTVGFLFSPELEFYISDYVGVTIAPYVLLNYIQSKYGVRVNIVLGILR